MTVLGLVRHGVTDWNQAGRLQGTIDIPLNSQGRMQASRLAERLKGEPLRWDAVFSSDLQRAYETARYIQEALQLDRIQVDQRLRERGFGQAEGMTREERELRYGSGLEHLPGAETASQVIERGKQFLDDLMTSWNGKHVLIVSHGGFLIRLFSLLTPDLDDRYIDNASLTIVRQTGGGWQLSLHNCIDHYVTDRPAAE